MPRIARDDIPANKQVEIALTYIFGIGRAISKDILLKAQVEGTTRASQLTDQEIAKIREVIEREHMVEGDLRKEISQNIRRLIELSAYRGIRHRNKLPVRGQRTHTNARTRKGRTKLAVAGKKKAI